MIRHLCLVTMLFFWGFIMLATSETHVINFPRIAYKGNCPTFTSPMYKLDPGGNSSSFEARTQRADLTLKEVTIAVKNGTTECVDWFDVYSMRNYTRRYRDPNRDSPGVKEFKSSGRTAKKISFSINLEIEQFLRIQVSLSHRCNRSLGIFAIQLFLEIGEMCCHCNSTEDCQTQIPRVMPLKKCRYFWNALNHDQNNGEESYEPWSKWNNYFTIDEHINDASTSNNETKKSMLPVSNQSLVIGAAIGGGLIIISNVVVCIIIRKFRNKKSGQSRLEGSPEPRTNALPIPKISVVNSRRLDEEAKYQSAYYESPYPVNSEMDNNYLTLIGDNEWYADALSPDQVGDLRSIPLPPLHQDT